jgi:hypothetical protein
MSASPGHWWKVVGIVLAVLVAIAGLALLSAVVIVFVAMGSYGSNK